MKINFDNQAAKYPIVLLPEKVLDILTKELTSDEIAAELGISPPIKKSVKRPIKPLPYKYETQHKTKIETPLGSILWLIAFLTLPAAGFASLMADGVLKYNWSYSTRNSFQNISFCNCR
jgi:hypothetical protein